MFDVVGFHPIFNICVDVSVLLLGWITAVSGYGIAAAFVVEEVSSGGLPLTAGSVCISFLTQFMVCALSAPFHDCSSLKACSYLIWCAFVSACISTPIYSGN